MLSEPVHGISDGGVCATSKALDQPAHARSLIGAFACRLSVIRQESHGNPRLAIVADFHDIELFGR